MEWAKKLTTKDLVNLSMLIALNIICNKFLMIPIGNVAKVGFGFIPVAISGALFGPVLAGLAAVVADLLRMALFPDGGSFHLGFTINAFLTAFVYGAFFYQQHKQILMRNIMANIIIAVVINLGLNTFWLSQILGIDFFVLLEPRFVSNIILLAVKIPIIEVLYVTLIQRIRLYY